MELSHFFEQASRFSGRKVTLSARRSSLLVGMATMNVKGTTKPISTAPTSHMMAPPTNHAATPAKKTQDRSVELHCGRAL